MINVPNLVTVARVILALFTIGMLFVPGDGMRFLAFGLTALIIWGDGIDGFLARKLNQCTEFGAMLDIAGDRVVEMAYWIAFASLGWIPIWVPLLFLVRGTFVDSIRAFAAKSGHTAFGAKTMMQSSLGKFLVASNFSRFSYAVAKALAFGLVILAQTQRAAFLEPAALFCVYFSSLFCLLRGLPVLIEGRYLFGGGSEGK